MSCEQHCGEAALSEVYGILRAAAARSRIAARTPYRLTNENSAPATTRSGVSRSDGGNDGYNIVYPC
jgi:hypothetical protein